MKLLVATGCDCFVYDLLSRARTPVPRLTPGERDAYGITWSSDHVYIGWRFPAVVEEYDYHLNPTERQLVPVAGGEFERKSIHCAVHQLLHLDGRILVVDTGHNRICEYTHDSLRCSNVMVPHDVVPDNASDICRHYNSIYAEPDRLWVLAHMHNEGLSRILQFTRHGAGLKGLQFETLVRAGLGGHNIFRTAGGRLATCDSMRGRIVALEPPGEVLYQGEAGSVIRGVAWAGSTLVAGSSQLTVERERRAEGYGRLLVWHDGNMRATPEVHELGSGPVHEVRCLDLADGAHWPNRPLCAC